jgi:hypothetical protein
MKRFQFGLRLYLLVIALLATCFAWIGALRLKQASDRETARILCETTLMSEVRWREQLLDYMKRPPSDPQAMPLANGLAELKNIETRMTAVRQELELLK